MPNKMARPTFQIAKAAVARTTKRSVFFAPVSQGELQAGHEQDDTEDALRKHLENGADGRR